MNDHPIKPESVDVTDWQMPMWDSQGNVIEPEMEPEAASVEENPVEKLKLPTASELQTIRDDAFSEGYDNGYKEGLTNGKKQGHDEAFPLGKEEGFKKGESEGLAKGETAAQKKSDQELQKISDVWQGLMAKLEQSILDSQPDLQKTMVQMMVQICRNVIGEELTLNPEHIGNIVKQALSALPPESHHINVILNQSDVDVLSALPSKPLEDISITASNEVLAGGCKVETKFSYVDFSLTGRFQNQLEQWTKLEPTLSWQELTDLSKTLPNKEDIDIAEPKNPKTDSDQTVSEHEPETEEEINQDASKEELHLNSNNESNNDSITKLTNDLSEDQTNDLPASAYEILNAGIDEKIETKDDLVSTTEYPSINETSEQTVNEPKASSPLTQHREQKDNQNDND